MKGQVFKSVIAISDLDFIQNNTPSASSSQFIKNNNQYFKDRGFWHKTENWKQRVKTQYKDAANIPSHSSQGKIDKIHGIQWRI